MADDSIKRVLSNWIRQAISGEGQLLPAGVDPASWVATQFLGWWRDSAVNGAIGDAELASEAIRSELERLGGFGNSDLGEAMHELIHLTDALNELKQLLGITAT